MSAATRAVDGAEADQLAGGEFVTAAAALDPETLGLADGRIVRLAGIDVPKWRADYDPNYASAATRLVNELIGNRRVELLRDVRADDRHGRVLAHVRRLDGEDDPDDWLQGALLSRGLARVKTLPGNTGWLKEMLELERSARAAGRGLWSDERYRLRSPDELQDVADRFQIVEGIVVDVAIVGGRGYLNFGPDYRTDFTVTFDATVRRLFEQSGVDPLAVKGRRIRVRGWLELFNGPMIELTHPEQIEVLE